MQAAASSGATAQANKKQREVYVGNLTIGVVTDVMLRDLFNGCLAHLSPIDASGTMPPIGADWQSAPPPQPARPLKACLTVAVSLWSSRAVWNRTVAARLLKRC